MDQKQNAKITQWKKVIHGDSFFLRGVVTDHPTLGAANETLCDTSEVLKMDDKTAETKNTIYELGPEFKEEEIQDNDSNDENSVSVPQDE